MRHLRLSDLQDNRLDYTIGKNTKGRLLKISEKARKIINEQQFSRDKNHDPIFPELKNAILRIHMKIK